MITLVHIPENFQIRGNDSIVNLAIYKNILNINLQRGEIIQKLKEYFSILVKDEYLYSKGDDVEHELDYIYEMIYEIFRRKNLIIKEYFYHKDENNCILWVKKEFLKNHFDLKD